MSVMPSRFLAMCSPSKWKMFSIPILALVFNASGAWAQAPSVLVDAQLTLGDWLQQPTIHRSFQERHNLRSGYQQQSDRLPCLNGDQHPGLDRNVRVDQPASAHARCHWRSLCRRHAQQRWHKFWTHHRVVWRWQGKSEREPQIRSDCLRGSADQSDLAHDRQYRHTVHRRLPAIGGWQPSIR